MGTAREEGGTAAGGQGRGGEGWGLTGEAWLAREKKERRGAARPGTKRGAASASAALSHVIYTISSLISLHVRGSRLQLLPIRLYCSLRLNTSFDLPSVRRLRRRRRRRRDCSAAAAAVDRRR